MSPYRPEEINQPVAASSQEGTIELRSDVHQRDIVTSSLALLGESGVMTALEYLKTHAVRPQVIERVLLEPRRRRAIG